VSDVSVIIPHGGDCPHRAEALGWVRDRFAASYPDWQVVIGQSHAEPWAKADAVADGLARADGDIIAVHDGDVWCNALHTAVWALGEHRWAVPHHTVHRLTPEATTRVLDGGEPIAGPRPASDGGRYERVHPGFLGGGIVVLHRELYEAVPLDRRFRGWGHEDESWAWALQLMGGKPHRGKHRLFHLWHPPQPRNGGRGSDESWRLRERYRHLFMARDRSGMATLLAGV
jgi:hypothetical protein